MANTDTDIEFRASDLISHAGVGSNGEKLVNLLTDFYPAELQAAQLRRVNPRLDDELQTDKNLAAVAKIVGVDRISGAHVRGGDSADEDALVTYVWLDDQGQAWKGCFPYSDLGSGKSDRHVSQRDSLAASAIAREHVAAQPTRSSSQQPLVDPIDFLSGASADELVALMREHPDRADAIKAFEEASRGDRARKTVLDFEPEGEGEGGGEPTGPGAPAA